MAETEGKARRRAPYANGQRTRAALVDAAFEVFAEQGFQRMSIRQIAEAIGTSHTALLHHFGSKDALLQAVLARREEREGPERDRLLAEVGFLDAVPAIMKLNATEPGVIQLDSVLRIEALNPDHAAHQFVERQQQEFYESVLASLTAEDEAGHLRPGLDLPVIARLITSLVSGIQLAWLADRSVDMSVHLKAFLDLLRRSPVAE